MARGVALVSYQHGYAKVYLPNGAQSPKLPVEAVMRWIELGGDWVRHALDPPPYVEPDGVVYGSDEEFLASL